MTHQPACTCPIDSPQLERPAHLVIPTKATRHLVIPTPSSRPNLSDRTEPLAPRLPTDANPDHLVTPDRSEAEGSALRLDPLRLDRHAKKLRMVMPRLNDTDERSSELCRRHSRNGNRCRDLCLFRTCAPVWKFVKHF
jgi:hypothetical protein